MSRSFGEGSCRALWKRVNFKAALQSDMSPQHCTAEEVDGATTKMRCEKKGCENMSHEL